MTPGFFKLHKQELKGHWVFPVRLDFAFTNILCFFQGLDAMIRSAQNGLRVDLGTVIKIAVSCVSL